MMQFERVAAPALLFPITLPPGRFHLDAAMDDDLRASCGGPLRASEIAHPALTFVAALGGAGLPVAEILARCGCSIDAGPLLAACELEWARPLQVNKVYQVAGEVTSKDRKASRRFGEADHLSLRFAISTTEVHHATLTLRMIVPVVAS